MATKRFRSNTGYPITVYATDPAGRDHTVRVDAEEPFETDDKGLIAVLRASALTQEVKAEPRKVETKDIKGAHQK